MPEPNTHAAIGLGASYAIGVLAGLNPDYLVIATVGALIAAGRQSPPDRQEKIGLVRYTIFALSNIAGVSLVSAASTSIMVVKVPTLGAVGVCIAALLGFFGQPLIASATKFISNTWELASNIISRKFGGGE